MARHPVSTPRENAALCFRWSAEAEAKEPDAPCRRINSIYTIHTILVGVPVLPDGYGSLSEIGFPQARTPLVTRSYMWFVPSSPLLLGPCSGVTTTVLAQPHYLPWFLGKLLMYACQPELGEVPGRSGGIRSGCSKRLMSSLPNWRHWKSRLSASTSGAATSCTRTSKCAPASQQTVYEHASDTCDR